MGFGGAALKISATAVRAVQFLLAIALLGIFSYFLVYLQHQQLPVLTFVRAVEGIAGVAALYTLVAFFLTCFLGGVGFFAFVGIALDLAFAAAFIAVAVLTKDGTTDCGSLSGGSTGIYGDTTKAVGVSADEAQRICHLYQGAFAIGILLLILFLVSALLQFFLSKHHQREKRKGADSHSGPRFPVWRRGRASRRDVELQQGAIPTR